jgi:hypothetical protein
MFKYFKGNSILSDEKLLSSLEIATEYNLWMPYLDRLSPNGELVDLVIRNHFKETNHKSSEYYYINEYNISFPVYLPKIVTPIMENFIKSIKEKGIVSNRDSVYSFNDIKFIYYEKPSNDDCEMIDFEKYLRKKGKKDDNSMSKL